MFGFSHQYQYQQPHHQTQSSSKITQKDFPDNPEKPVTLEDYPTYNSVNKLRKDTPFIKFIVLYDKIKTKVNERNGTGTGTGLVKMQLYNEIKSIAKVMCIDVKSVYKHFDYLSYKLYDLLKKVNKAIVYAGQQYQDKGKGSNSITKKGNIYLCNQFKKLRKDQPQCISTNYVVPSKFSFKSTVLNKTFEGITNSLNINNEIYKEVLNCFNTLLTLMSETIIISIGGSYLNFLSIRQLVEDEFKKEIPIPNSRMGGGGKGSFKKTKKIVQFKSNTKLKTKLNTKLKTKRKLKMHSKFHKKPNSS